MRNSAGQALVLVLLSLAVVLTLVLFILARTVTDIAVSTTEEEAIRAFSAAEAGIEKALVIGAGGVGSVGDANFSASVTGYAEGTRNFNYPVDLASGDTATIWFARHLDDGTLTPSFTGDSVKVCWGKPGTPSDAAETPAIEFSIFYDDGAVKIGRSALDPNSGRTAANSFTSVPGRDCDIDGTDYAFWSDINLDALSGGTTEGLLFGKLRMFYNSNQSQIAGFSVTGGNLPSQGLNIDSSGTAGGANRRLEVFQAWPEPPTIFDSAVFSPGGLIK